MNLRPYIFLAPLAAGHLLLVGLGASYVDLTRLGPIGEALNLYGEATGSSHSYGFFAPGVGSQVRARFEVVDESGKNEMISLQSGASHEGDLRVGNIIDQFVHMLDEVEEQENLRRSLAASLAGSVFGEYPKAREVVVHLDEFVPVSMADYRAGERAKWDEIYTARFRNDAPTTAEANL